MRNFFIVYFFLIALTLTVLGFRGCKSERTPIEIFPDMDRQARFNPQSQTSFFADGRTDRPQVPGAVPFVTAKQENFPHLAPDNRFREDSYLVTGRVPDLSEFGSGIPIALNEVNMLRGQELYNIYCAICHGTSGNGLGVVADPRYGFNTIVSILQQRIIDQPDGEIYDTIANGRNTMYAYGSKIRVEDRWKVVMYVRALQRASAASVQDVPADRRGELGL